MAKTVDQIQKGIDKKIVDSPVVPISQISATKEDVLDNVSATSSESESELAKIKAELEKVRAENEALANRLVNTEKGEKVSGNRYFFSLLVAGLDKHYTVPTLTDDSRSMWSRTVSNAVGRSYKITSVNTDYGFFCNALKALQKRYHLVEKKEEAK